MSLPPPTLPAPTPPAPASPTSELAATNSATSAPVVPEPVTAEGAVAPPAPPIPTLDATTPPDPQPRKWTTVLGIAVVVVIVAAGAALAYDQWIAGGDESPSPAEPTSSIPGDAVTEPVDSNGVDEAPSTPPILGPATVQTPADEPLVESPATNDDQVVVPLEQPAAPPIEAPTQPATEPADAGEPATAPPAEPVEVPAPPIDSPEEVNPGVGAPASGGLEQPVRVGNAIDSATDVVDAVNDRLPDDELLDDVLGD